MISLTAVFQLRKLFLIPWCLMILMRVRLEITQTSLPPPSVPALPLSLIVCASAEFRQFQSYQDTKVSAYSVGLSKIVSLFRYSACLETGHCRQACGICLLVTDMSWIPGASSDSAALSGLLWLNPSWKKKKIIFLHLKQERAAGHLLSVSFQPNPL